MDNYPKIISFAPFSSGALCHFMQFNANLFQILKTETARL